MFDQDFIALERTFFGDTIYVRWADIRAITGAVGAPTPNDAPSLVEGASTIYMEGELGWSVNHTPEEIAAMIKAKQVRN